MRSFTATVKFKLMLAFGSCAFLMVFLGTGSGYGLATAGSTVRDVDRVMMTIQVVVTFGAGLAAVVFGWWIYRSVCGSLDRMVAQFGNIAETLDLTKRFAGSQASAHKDEFGHAGVEFDRLITQVEKAVSAVRSSTDLVSVATNEIATGNQHLSARTEQQAASLEQTAASMDELTGSVRSNAENARTALDLASSAKEIATRGNEVVANVVSTMNAISVSSTKIADITGMIEGIAFQTNILSLNAAVEAARAGEEGRGFAVVAGEVRSLAQRAASAAKEIKDLINMSVGQVSAGNELASQAGATMEELSGSVSRVTAIMSEISAASDEQSKGIEQIGVAISQIDEVTQQNAALVEEAAAAAQSLAEQAGKLKEAVGLFKLA
jgi:methyl-accepting chemotaxis protein